MTKGAVGGKGTILGMVLDGTQVRDYVCDGTPSHLATLAEWFAGVGVFEGTAIIAGQRYHAGWLRLSGGDQRGAATFYPTGPI